MDAEKRRIRPLRDKLERALLTLEASQVNGDTTNRLDQISNMSFKYVQSEALMQGLSKNIAVSSGSACTSASLEPSHVLKALGLDDDLSHSSIRFGLGRFTSEEEIDYAVSEVKKTVMRLREHSPLWEMHKMS